jgi:hypothetical protein
MTTRRFLQELRDNLLKGMHSISKDFAYDYDANDDEQFISDCFTEYADSKVDLYYSDLINWISRENASYIEEYVEEFGMPENNNYKKFDFMKLIQGGQFYKNYKELYEDEVEIKGVIYLNKLLDTLSEEELNAATTEELRNNVENIVENEVCDVDRFYEYEDLINETFDFDK